MTEATPPVRLHCPHCRSEVPPKATRCWLCASELPAEPPSSHGNATAFVLWLMSALLTSIVCLLVTGSLALGVGPGVGAIAALFSGAALLPVGLMVWLNRPGAKRERWVGPLEGVVGGIVIGVAAVGAMLALLVILLMVVIVFFAIACALLLGSSYYP